MNDQNNFDADFKHLTGNHPFPWQKELYKRLIQGSFPPACSLPTGLGKTSIIAIWLLALAETADGSGQPRPTLPRRLAYVVNRRTIVDQATREAEKLRENLLGAKHQELRSRLQALSGNGGDESPLSISTLRGQFADNGEWSADPARPAIIVGTVDMIGSRLLFSGYGRGFKHRPLHAGFLGQDTLLVHDEAHLEPAFQKLLDTIKEEQDRCKDFRSFHIMSLTATPRTPGETFVLSEEEQNPPTNIPDPPTEPIHYMWRRLTAKKTIDLHEIEDEKKMADRVAELAIKRAKSDPGKAILVFVRKVEDVKLVAEALSDPKFAAKHKTETHPSDKVARLTGTLRGLERDKLVKTPVFQRFLHPSNRKGDFAEGTVFLVCTSAGEVGVDISADHLICDLTTFESMAQRFGRVNRYGDGDAKIDVVYPAKFEKDGKDKEYQARRERTLELLRKLNGYASPKALGNAVKALAESLKENGSQQRVEDVVFSPTPEFLDATDILFDAWALTSIRGKMPGRPEVGPYLHGIADDQPQTTIAWRAELDLFKDDPNPKSALKAIFSKHRIRPHESLTVRSYEVVKFLKEMTAPNVRPDLLDSRVVLMFARSLELTTIQALINDSRPLYADPTLILPASFGGLNDKGMLNASKPDNKKKKNDSSDDNAAAEQNDCAVAMVSTLDIADISGYEREPGAKSRMRVLINRTADGWSACAIPGAAPLASDWDLVKPQDTSTPLDKHLQKKSGLRIRLKQPIELDDEDSPVRSLICLSPPPPSQVQPNEGQTLVDHVCAVEKEADRLANTLLKNDKVAATALRFAAKWHDEGKKAAIWQRYIGGPDANGNFLGKAAKWCDPKKLCGYRHEFGSLLRIEHADEHKTPCVLPGDPDVKNLALHLIAAHHGHARPHFRHTIDRDFSTQQSDQTHTEAIRRFALLQHKYGRWGLAYLESLLRAADIAASRAVGIDPEIDDDEDPADSEGGAQ